MWGRAAQHRPHGCNAPVEKRAEVEYRSLWDGVASLGHAGSGALQGECSRRRPLVPRATGNLPEEIAVMRHKHRVRSSRRGVEEHGESLHRHHQNLLFSYSAALESRRLK
ncbi:hypothetical protein NDU88_000883 [Pleurodeles waltl]|uniref:Uncharacterized protein n=1 Tax=Pleurodeles waltl TaxID=8319 RepID=A0AAV7P5G3_PLEWA|nr:hypothetical protein NDU88_000883 [Pleurodeles waltl]